MKIVKILLVTTLLLMYTSIGAFAAQPYSSAQSAILIDGSSGRVLYEKNIHQKLPMASTTKIMTTIVALENANLDDIVTIAPEASGIEGSSIWLAAGEKQTLEDLLYGLMLRSGNDAATAIAIHVSGTVEKFAELMNVTARRIGAKNSNFVNPHGLHADKHYTTAYDLAIITAYGMKMPEFQAIASAKYRTIPWEGHKWDRAMKNKNELLWTYEGANGVKIGYTKRAGRCFVGSAKRDNMQLISVVINCSPMFEDSAALLDYGFNNYSHHEVIAKDQLIKTVPVDKGKTDVLELRADSSFSIALAKNEAGLLKTELFTPEKIQAPVEAGSKLGIIKIYFDDQLMDEISIIASDTVEKRRFWDFFRNMVKLWR